VDARGAGDRARADGRCYGPGPRTRPRCLGSVILRARSRFSTRALHNQLRLAGLDHGERGGPAPDPWNTTFSPGAVPFPSQRKRMGEVGIRKEGGNGGPWVTEIRKVAFQELHLDRQAHLLGRIGAREPLEVGRGELLVVSSQPTARVRSTTRTSFAA